MSWQILMNNLLFAIKFGYDRLQTDLSNWCIYILWAPQVLGYGRKTGLGQQILCIRINSPIILVVEVKDQVIIADLVVETIMADLIQVEILAVEEIEVLKVESTLQCL